VIYAPIAAPNGIDSKQVLKRLRATLNIYMMHIQLDLPISQNHFKNDTLHLSQGLDKFVISVTLLQRFGTLVFMCIGWSG